VKRRNLRDTSQDVEVEYKETDHGPDEYAPWYQQFMKLSDGKKALMGKMALQNLIEAKPDLADFIHKYKCEIVGLQPRIEYALFDKREGETDVTWVHSFSMPTLLYWSKTLEIGFFVNANLKYNDTVLNTVNGNRKQSLRGFTS